MATLLPEGRDVAEVGSRTDVGGIRPASGWAVRQHVAKYGGYEVSHPQLTSFLAAGLLPGWPDLGVVAHANQLQQVCELGKTVRSIPRRVLLLRRSWFEFPIADELVVDALVRLVPTVKAPKHKMKSMERVFRLALPQLYVGWYAMPTAPPGLFERDRWRHILRSVSTGIQQSWIHGTYSVVTTVIPMRVEEPRLDNIIPVEEQLLLVSLMVAVRQYRVTA